MTIHTLYDPAVYMATEEYEQKTGKQCKKSIQKIVSCRYSSQLAASPERIYASHNQEHMEQHLNSAVGKLVKA